MATVKTAFADQRSVGNLEYQFSHWKSRPTGAAIQGRRNQI